MPNDDSAAITPCSAPAIFDWLFTEGRFTNDMRFLHKGYKAGDEKKYRKMVKKLVRE